MKNAWKFQGLSAQVTGRAAMHAAREALEAGVPDAKLYIHVFSNGGTFVWEQLTQVSLSVCMYRYLHIYIHIYIYIYIYMFIYIYV